jgi:proline iminopeptidase
MTDIPIPADFQEVVREHVKRYLESDGKDGHMWDSSIAGGPGPVPTLLLTTTGRKSGTSIILPLIYGKTGKDFVVVASKGGAPAHPAWYLNLCSNPQVQVQVEAQHYQATARTATGAERAALWDQMVEIYPPYTDYMQRTEREIPVVVLETE